jgi:DNA-binding transcriptional regulator YdaS (Cro superfamily)
MIKLQFMDKQTLLDRLGGARRVAELLGISVQAVHQWDEVPPSRLYQLAHHGYITLEKPKLAPRVQLEDATVQGDAR